MEALQPSEPNDSQAGFVNKVLLEHSHINLFASRLWLLSYSPSKLSSCYKDLIAPRTKTFTSGLLQEICVDPWNLRERENQKVFFTVVQREKAVAGEGSNELPVLSQYLTIQPEAGSRQVDLVSLPCQ